MDIEKALSGVVDPAVYVFVVDVVTSFDTVGRGTLDRVLPAWFWHVFSMSCTCPASVQVVVWFGCLLVWCSLLRCICLG